MTFRRAHVFESVLIWRFSTVRTPCERFDQMTDSSIATLLAEHHQVTHDARAGLISKTPLVKQEAGQIVSLGHEFSGLLEGRLIRTYQISNGVEGRCSIA